MLAQFIKIFSLIGAFSEPSEEDLKKHYRELCDTAFRNIVPGDLTPMARKCYDLESLARSKKATVNPS